MDDLNQTDSSWKKMVIAKTNNEWKSSIGEDMEATSNTTHFSLDEAPRKNIKREIEETAEERESDSTEPVGMIQELDPLSLLISSKGLESKTRRRKRGSGPTTETPVKRALRLAKHSESGAQLLANKHSHMSEPVDMIQEMDPLSLLLPIKDVIPKSRRQRKDSTPKSETSDERAARLAKMSAYAAQRLANESPEQRANRLKRMSEYAAKRLSSETKEQRATRLARMSAYAARRLANESPEQRQARLERMSAYAAKRHAIKKTYNTLDESLHYNVKPSQS